MSTIQRIKVFLKAACEYDLILFYAILSMITILVFGMPIPFLLNFNFLEIFLSVSAWVGCLMFISLDYTRHINAFNNKRKTTHYFSMGLYETAKFDRPELTEYDKFVLGF